MRSNREWTKKSVALKWLRKQAFDHQHRNNILGWLKAIGLVPDDVNRLAFAHARTDVDPADINVGYLAAVAYEWDTWGESTPRDFIKAMDAECRGPVRDDIMTILASLGRQADALPVAA